MQSPIFVLGVPRSGTTLLRVMLAGNPRLFSPPEMVIAPFPTMAERKAALEVRFWEKGGLRRTIMELLGVEQEEARRIEDGMEGMTVPEVYAWIAERLRGSGPERAAGREGAAREDRVLVDKCPHLAGDPAALDRLAAWYPDARYLWIVRHPGSVIRSLENMPMAEVMLSGYGGDAQAIWAEGNRNFERFLSKIPQERWLRIRYEDIVTDARGPMEAFCAVAGLPFDAAMLDPYEGDRMREGPKGARAIGDPNMAGRGRVQPELATAWLEGFDASQLRPETRAVAAALGYDLSALGTPPLRTLSDAMQAFFGSVAKIEQGIKMPADLDAAEGRRFLLRVAAGAIETFVEWGDPDHPSFNLSESPIRKTFGDNPDADYHRAPIRIGEAAEGRIYRVRGRVPPGTCYVGLLLYRRGGAVGSRLRDDQCVRWGAPGEDGAFDVVIAREDPCIPGTTFLKAAGDELSVMVRQYFTDRAREAPIGLEIARVGAGGAPLDGAPGPLDPLALAKAVERARRMVEATFERTLTAWRFGSTGALNRFLPVDAEALFPTPDNAYGMCWYRFGRDQLMLIRGRLPRCRYFAFTLYNAWLESFDYEHHRVSLNHTQIRAIPGTEQDGSGGEFEICLAHRDPGHPNWISTTGHLAGFLVTRTLLPAEGPEGTPGPLSIRVMYEREWRRPDGEQV